MPQLSTNLKLINTLDSRGVSVKAATTPLANPSSRHQHASTALYAIFAESADSLCNASGVLLYYDRMGREKQVFHKC